MKCLGCMQEIDETIDVCPYCGYVKGTQVREAYYLLPGKMLGGKYLIGKVLGYGGFGVTYIGWDCKLDRKVAIKEYLPSDFSTRSYGSERLTVFSGEATVQFEAGLQSFITEAKRLARFNTVPETVDIYDCFMENDTGYIIMEFLEGKTVKEILRERKKIPFEEAREIIMPVLRGLSKVHKEGIIHRDIAPDNIFITKTGEVRILDFGAARYATAVQSKSLSVILKPGYAPEEQYRSRGEQGPWTDVYATAATFYRMITGVRPEESIERLGGDTLKTPSELGVTLPQSAENTILNALNVKKENRTKDAEAFYQELESTVEVPRIVVKNQRAEAEKLPIWIKITAGAAGALLLVCIVLVASGQISFSKKQIQSDEGMVSLQDGECYVPDISGISYEEAREALRRLDLDVVINGMNYSETIEKNKILSQNPGDGAKVMAKDTVYVVMSGGNQEVIMPDLSGMIYEDASEMLLLQGLIMQESDVVWEYSDVVEKNRVITQSVEANARLAVNTEVGITVSKGSISAETAVLTVPDLTGLTKEEAIERLGQLKEQEGFTFTLGEITMENSTEVEKDKIIRQGIAAGSKVRTDQVISLVVSAGPEVVNVPNVVYLDQDEARERMEAAGLKTEIVREYSAQVAKGCVISQSVKDGESVEKGSTVTLKVSLGKEAGKDDKKGNAAKSSESGQQSPDKPGGGSVSPVDGGSNGGGSVPPVDGGSNGGGSVPPADTPWNGSDGSDGSGGSGGSGNGGDGKSIEIDPGNEIEIDEGNTIEIE